MWIESKSGRLYNTDRMDEIYLKEVETKYRSSAQICCTIRGSEKELSGIYPRLDKTTRKILQGEVDSISDFGKVRKALSSGQNYLDMSSFGSRKPEEEGKDNE